MKKILEKFKSIDSGTLIRTFTLLVAYVNQIISLIGLQSFAQSMVYQIISLCLTLTVSAIAAWKNNDFTHLAQLSGAVLKALRDGRLEENEVKDLLNKGNENLK